MMRCSLFPYRLLALMALFSVVITDAAAFRHFIAECGEGLSPQGGSVVYVGGHIRRERPATVTKLKNSGFNTVILFNINVEPDGTLTTDGETVCREGEYVFADTQPHYADDVRELKTWPTGIGRIEICIGGWGNESYSRIKELIAQQGTGTESVLYRNFLALKQAIPEIDAVNNDDEYCYDLHAAVAFHTMMWNIGYHTSLAPYTRRSFWENLASQLNEGCPGACDRVLVQCYDGGAANNPADWHLDGLPVFAGRTNYQSSMEESVGQMTTWRDNSDVVGGFVWVYNDETWNLNEWASAINRVFPSREVAQPAVTLFSKNNYAGYQVVLPEGEFCTGELSAFGLTDKDIASYRLEEGYRMEAYESADLTGQMRGFTDIEMPRMGAWAHRISSLRIVRDDDDAISNTQVGHTADGGYYDLQGRRLAAPPSRGVYIVRNNRLSMKRIVK